MGEYASPSPELRAIYEAADAYTLDGLPVVFYFKARIIRWVDADTVEVHPIFAPAGINFMIRLKDVWEIEIEDDVLAHQAALENAQDLIGDEGDFVICKNYRHHKTWERLEARVDGA